MLGDIKELTIGIAGCGAMGLPMATNLKASGFNVTGFDIRPASEFGAFTPNMSSTVAEFAAISDIVICVVRDWPQTLDLCFEEQALFKQEKYPKILVISSTLSPRQILILRDKLPSDVALIDAPMSGASNRAKSGELTFMLGGEEDVVRDLKPMFTAMGNQIFHLGALSTGMTCKVLNNMLAATNVIAVRRMRACAQALGLAPEKFQEIASRSSGANWFGDNFDVLDWAEQSYAKDNTIGILEKDMQSMLDAVQDHPHLSEDGFEDAVLKALREL